MQQYPLRKRASATQLPPHRAGHSINHHPEDEPYLTDQRTANTPLALADQLDYAEEPTRTSTSAVRWRDTQGHQVIQRGNKRLVVHDEPPPRHRRRPHWLFISGVSIMSVVLFIWFVNGLVFWWHTTQLNATYEFPRVSQADAVVYPGDSAAHPSHYLFLNLDGTVLIIELPHGDSAKARVYTGPTLFDANADQIPVTGEFQVVNGKIEMLVHIQDKVILYVNNGTQFIPQ